MSVKHLYSDNFEAAIGMSPMPAVVDFWASWCNPCRMLAPIVEDLSDALDGRAEFFKVDVDEAGDIAAAYGVMSIPTVVVFDGGGEKGRVVGYRSRDELLEFIEGHL